jgi:UDP-N-acetylmuramate dehydrogenase
LLYLHRRKFTAMQILQDVSLQPHNTFGLDVRAKHWITITTAAQLQTLLRNPDYQSLPKLVLGGGSNVLFTQDFRGLLIKMAIPGIDVVEEDKAQVWVRVGAGVDWHELVMHCITRGYGGIENLSLIPGTVGAAPLQNIGAYGVEIKDVFASLEAVEVATGDRRTFGLADCHFGYRSSVFKHELKGQYIITSVTFLLQKHPVVNTSYGAITETLSRKGVTAPTIRDVSEAVIDIRRSKLPDPQQIGNAGSFFKNPVIPRTQYEALLADYPTLPGYPAEDAVKVPAGWLIEQCGWKGKRLGNVGVHNRQALVLVHFGGGKGESLVALAQDIKASVLQKFGITIEPEVNMI